MGTHAKFKLEILIINVISGIVCFREIMFESLESLAFESNNELGLL